MRNHGHDSTNHLLVERDLTLAKAVSLAQSVDIAQKEAKALQIPTGNMTNMTELYKVRCGATAGSENKSGKAKNKYNPVCYYFGGKHLAPKCCFISEKCHSCGKQGHIAKVCRSTQSKSSSIQKGESSTTSASVIQRPL